MIQHEAELKSGERFAFGANWQSFLRVVDQQRVAEAEEALRRSLGDLQGLTFLDIGCGSGLSSLAARRLGAIVHSFDYDPRSVVCTRALKNMFMPEDDLWTIAEGSVLDLAYLKRLGQYDVVYSWGVLHHTGAMWQALENIGGLVKEEGRLMIAIYNHQVYWTRFFKSIKRFYNRLPSPGRWLMAISYIALKLTKGFIKDLCLLRSPLVRYKERKRTRGMSMIHDWIDWLGGYPFETAKPEEIFNFFRDRGYLLQELLTAGGGCGCNQFVFGRGVHSQPAGPPSPVRVNNHNQGIAVTTRSRSYSS